jgi:hypothetical protein
LCRGFTGLAFREKLLDFEICYATGCYAAAGAFSE